MKKTYILVTVLLIGFSMLGNASAMDLQSARTSGMVGEGLDGFVKVINSTPEVEALVSDVNNRRITAYEGISKENNQPVSVVAKLAVKQIVAGLPKGAFYKSSNGEWIKK